jgi:hypothetical protein
MASKQQKSGGSEQETQKASAARSSSSAAAEETGQPDEDYGLISVLYHSLQGAETYSQYIQDAEKAGDELLTDFFKSVRDEEVERAARAKELLADRLSDDYAEEESVEEEEMDESDEEKT